MALIISHGSKMKKKINLFLEFRIASGQFRQDTCDKPALRTLIYVRADKIYFIGIDKMTNNTVIKVNSCGDRYEIEGCVETTKEKIENKLAEIFTEN